MATRISLNPFISFVKDITFHGLEVFGKYYSCYRGFVVDNQDPEYLNRLKLAIPQINGKELHDYWAYPKNLFSGTGYGVQCIPQKGEVVWVEFEGGQIEVPLWSHGHRAKKEVIKDPEFQDYNSYWFKTPRGNLVKINDTKNTIQITLSNGTSIEVDENVVSVIGKNVSLGTLTKSAEHAVLGDTLKSKLDTFINIVNNIKIIGGTVSPDDKIKLLKLQFDLSQILSHKVTLD